MFSTRTGRAFGSTSTGPTGDAGDRVSHLENLTQNFAEKLFIEAMKAPNDIDKTLRLYDHKNLYSFSKWMKTVKLALKHGEYYSEFQEAWVSRQFHPRGPAHEKWQRFYEARLDNTGRIYTNNGTKTAFQDFKDLLKNVTDALFIREDMFGMVQRYTNHLAISRDEPDSPRNGMQLIDYATSAFNLLPADQVFSEAQQISIISGCLPSWMKTRIDHSRPVQPTITTSMDDFRRAVQYMDEEHTEKTSKPKRPTRHLSERRHEYSDSRRGFSDRRRDHRDSRRDLADRRRPNYQSDRNRFEPYHRRSATHQQPRYGQRNSSSGYNRPYYPNHHSSGQTRPTGNFPAFHGTCAHCKKPGHKIWQCPDASTADKNAFSEKLARKGVSTPMQTDRNNPASGSAPRFNNK